MINGIQSSGISFGLDRLELLSDVKGFMKKVLVVSLGEDKKSLEIADIIRKANVGCSLFYGKPGKALDYANSYSIEYVVFVGEDETKKNIFKIKDMKTGKEHETAFNKIKNYFEKL